MRQVSLICLLFISSLLHAQQDRERVEYLIRNLYLDQADQLASTISPGELGAYYQSRIAFYRYLCTEKPSLAESFFSVSKSSLQQIDHFEKDHPLKKVFLSEIHLQRGVVHFMQKNYWGTTIEFRKSCHLIEDNYDDFPENVEQKKLLGMYYAVLSAVPGKFRWLSDIFCFSGDLKKGIKMLKDAGARSTILPEEAVVLQFYITKSMLNESEEALEQAKQLLQTEPDNPVYTFLYAVSLMDEKRNEEALKLLRDGRGLMEEAGRQKIIYWDFMLGRSWYYKLDTEKAIAAFDRFLKNQEGNLFRNDAVFRKGVALILADRYNEAQALFKKEIEASGFDEDNYAGAMARKFAAAEPSAATKDLFRARNLFDGGYHHQAIAFLDRWKNSPSLTVNELCELNYRYGRIFDEKGEKDKAAEYYRKATQTEPVDALWMKVYAWYHLAEQLYEAGKSAEARKLYEKALSFDGYFYQSGLEQKCKARLAEMTE